jgi:nuclear GTP-binding protein
MYPGKGEMLEEQDLRKEIEKNKSKHTLVSTKDLDNMVAEEKGENVVKGVDSSEFTGGKSKYDAKRELNNLIRESDVLIEVLDARDPLSYRSRELEKNIYNNKDKRLIVIINKTDLVSSENAEAWGKFIRRDIPTVLFSAKHPNGEAPFKELLEIIQSITKTMNKKISVGLVGYPNTGKTNILRVLREKFVTVLRSKALPLMNEIVAGPSLRFFDKPGYIVSKNEVGALMPKSAKNSEDVKNPMQVIQNIFDQIGHDEILELYEIPEFENVNDFLENIAKKKNYFIKVFFKIIFFNFRVDIVILIELQGVLLMMLLLEKLNSKPPWNNFGCGINNT